MRILATMTGYIPARENFELTEELGKKLEHGAAFIEFPVEIITLDDNVPTRNNVIYPLAEMKIAVERERLQQMLNTGVFLSELEHPDDPEDLLRWTKVDRTNVHSRFTKLWFEGNKLMGMVRTVPGNGNLMAKAILNGELPSFSIRVIGKPTKRDDGVVVLHDIHLIAVDWVTYPGNPTSYVKSSDIYKLVESPIAGGFQYPLLKASGEASPILREMGITEDLVSVGKGGYATLNDQYTSSMESVRIRNNIRNNAL